MMIHEDIFLISNYVLPNDVQVRSTNFFKISEFHMEATTATAIKHDNEDTLIVHKTTMMK